MPKGGPHGNLRGKAAKMYEALRDKGYSKARAAKISNAATHRRKGK